MKIDIVTLEVILKKMEKSIMGKTLSLSENVFFIDDFLFCFGGESGMIVPFSTPLKGGFPLSDFKKIITECVSKGIEEMEFIFDEQASSLSMKAEGVDINLNITSFVNDTIPFPFMIKETEGFDWRKLPADFNEAVRYCSFSVSQDDPLNKFFNYLLVYNNKVFGGYPYRISRYVLSSSIKDRVLLPFNLLKVFEEFNASFISENEGFVLFKNEEEHILLLRKIINDKFPDEKADSFFDITGKKISFPEQIIEKVDLSSIFSKEDFFIDKSIEVEFKSGKLLCKKENDFGSIITSLKIEGDDAFSFKIHPILFLEILKKSLTAVFNEEKNQLEFTFEKFAHILSLKIQKK